MKNKNYNQGYAKRNNMHMSGKQKVHNQQRPDTENLSKCQSNYNKCANTMKNNQKN